MTDPTYTPAISTKVRDRSYIGGLAVATLTPVAVIVASVIAPQIAQQAAQIGTAILSAVGIWTAGVGVAYRPGRGL